MLTRLRIKDFQSHKDTKLTLGQFTVIEGPSSSGKSAVIRALSLLVRNARGTSYVRHGASFTRVETSNASMPGDPSDAQLHVAVERGSNRSVYELTIQDQDTIKFTKCSTSVPETVEAAFDFGEDDTWLAGQFDRPFLLAETSSNVARVISELTNVNMIYAAVRELNKRALSRKQLYGASTKELGETQDKLRAFEDLPAQLACCSNAEQALSRAEQLSARRSDLAGRISALTDSYARLRVSQAEIRQVPDAVRLGQLVSLRSRLSVAIGEVTAAQSRLVSLAVVSVPDVSALTDLALRRQVVARVVAEGQQALARQRAALSQAEQLSCSVVEESERLAILLREAGVCPVCGADSEHAQLDHAAV